MKKYNIAVVGATGVVGSMFLEVLKEYNFPISELRLFASEKSEGKQIEYCQTNYVVHKLSNGCFKGIDIALFSAGASVSLIWALEAEKEGAYVIDNSSCWRQDETCALIVPEINFEDYKTKRKLIANPNCSTIQSVLPLYPLDKEFEIKRIVYSTYQACSGSGKKGEDDLLRTRNGGVPQFYPYNITETCIPEIDVFQDNRYSKEEMKMVNESRKILHNSSIRIAATCVRVPVMHSHGVSIMAEFNKTLNMEKVYEVLNNQEGIVVVDDCYHHKYPVSTLSTGTDKVYVGRIRKDLSSDNGLLMYTCGDNLRKGAASNAVQIALKLIKDWDKQL